MAKVIPGRVTAQADEPFVVFLIGIRINKFLAFRKWIPTARAMGPMLRTLYQHPEKGFLGAEIYFKLRGPVLIQYWRSFEDLERFARDKNDPHLSAWRRFNKAIGSDGSGGILHETFLVEAGSYEALYANMPVFAFAAPTKHVPAAGRRHPPSRPSAVASQPSLPPP